MRICLKELKETNVGLKIIDRGKLINNQELLDTAKKECGELIAIFVTSINTANKKL